MLYRKIKKKEEGRILKGEQTEVRKLVICYTGNPLQQELIAAIAERCGAEVKFVSNCRQARKAVILNPNLAAVVLDDPRAHKQKWLRFTELLNLLTMVRRNCQAPVVYLGHMLSGEAALKIGVDKMPPQLLRGVLTKA